MEAMSLGAAVVCADCRAGPSELITNGINGRLVPVDDVAVLARVISELIQDPDLRLQLGREAEKIRRRYEPEVIMKQWEACLWSNSPSFID
jgi:glycosyltransferase involved in cell wall biosynthesis